MKSETGTTISRRDFLADGVCFLTSYQGKYLGDAAFAPVMDELNRRSAVVYTHPARPDCCRNLIPDVPETMIELATDTTRTIASVLFSGTLARCPNNAVRLFPRLSLRG